MSHSWTYFMIMKGNMSPTKANSIVLRTTTNISIATNQPIPIVWGEVDGQPNAELFSHVKGRSDITSLMLGRVKISFKINCTLSGASGVQATRADTVVAFLALNEISIDRSVSFVPLYQQGGGLTTMSTDIDNVSVKPKDTLKLYVYRLTNNGTIRMAPADVTMSIELTTVNVNG